MNDKAFTIEEMLEEIENTHFEQPIEDLKPDFQPQEAVANEYHQPEYVHSFNKLQQDDSTVMIPQVNMANFEDAVLAPQNDYAETNQQTVKNEKPNKHARTKRVQKITTAVQSVNPWSVAKFTFFFSLVIGIAGIFAILTAWNFFENMEVFTSIQTIFDDLMGSTLEFSFVEIFSEENVQNFVILGATGFIGFMTLSATIFAFLYNLLSAMLGGFRLRFSN